MNQNRQILIVALVFCVTLPALASTIVVPGAQLASEGNSNNAYPFNLSNFSAQVLVPSGTQRYQQVYGASEFASAGGSLLISAIAFRVDGDPANGQPFCIAVACGEAVRIDLSTTSKGPDQLDLVFANNLGSSVSTVFNAPLRLSSSAAGGLHGFDVLIPFASSYL